MATTEELFGTGRLERPDDPSPPMDREEQQKPISLTRQPVAFDVAKGETKGPVTTESLWGPAPDKRKPAVRDLPTMSPENFLEVATARLREDAARNAGPQGFFDNLKNPLELWKTSMVGNLRKAAQAGVFEKEVKDLIKTGQQNVEHFNPADLYEEFKHDPGKMGAELINSVVQDPYLLFAPAGLGGALATRLGKVAGGAGRVAGRAAEAGAVGGGMVSAIEAAKMLKDLGYISPEGLVGPTEFGALFAGSINAAFGKGGKPRPVPPRAPVDWEITSTGDVVRGREPVPPQEVRGVFPSDKGYVDWLSEGAELESVAAGKPRIKLKLPKEALAAAGGAAALYAMDPEGLGEAAGGGAALAMAGAVKGKGGMWHPAAGERLAKPFFEKLSGNTSGMTLREFINSRPGDEATAKTQMQASWTEKAISRYLNKWAGTADDPLREIVLPSGKTWGEVTDLAIGKAKASQLTDEGIMDSAWKRFPGSEKIPAGEDIYDFGNYASSRETPLPAREIQDYLSHAGDYARQNIPADKLPQYDLVRLIRETSLNDARVVKEMEKARSAQTAQLPVHKEYPGGMKWVRLEEPKELTAEQARGVRPATVAEKRRFAETTGEDAFDRSEIDKSPAFVAVDSKGKVIVNSYTQAPVVEATPTRAFLAGRLAEEGNTMGHCFPAGTIVTAPTVNLIERVKLGDEVVTHTGAVRKVTQLFERRYVGDLFTVTSRGALPFSCTEEHPLLVLRPTSTGSHWQDRYIQNRLPETLLPQWLQANQLRVGDYLLSPGLQREEQSTELDDFAWMCGLYAGDGHCEEARIGFTLSPQDDLDRVRRVFETLGYEARLEDHDTYWRVRVNSKELAAKFKAWFGAFSQEKHLPAFLFEGGGSLKAVLEGLTAADGTYYDGRWRLVSTSIALAQQAWLIAVTLGYRPSIKTLKRKPSHGYANASPAWAVEWQEQEGKWHSNVRWNAFYATPVTEITKRQFAGQVYNLEVEEDHSYLVNGLAVHNCVGGYCEGVASGESKIYSLRDAKGESHVTIETQDPGKNRPRQLSSLKDILLGKEDILQIKGKQNRAPLDRYLPFVHDFVKGGKWGEVGDLGNTGLVQAKRGDTVTTLGKSFDASEVGLEHGKYYTVREVTDAARRLVTFDELKGALASEHPSVSIDLRQARDGTITLADIRLKPLRSGHSFTETELLSGARLSNVKEGEPITGRALGQKAITELTSYADANKRDIMLSAAGDRLPDGTPDPKAPPTAKLVEIYKRHGFEEAAYQPFPDIAVNMVRKHKGAADDTRLGNAAEAPRRVGEAEPRRAGGEGEGLGGRGQGRGEEGFVDPKLLIKASALTGGALIGASLNPDNRLTGAIYGALAAGVLTAGNPRSLVAMYRKMAAPDDRIRITGLMKEWDAFKEAQRLLVWQTTRNVRDMVPDAARRDVVHNALENPKYAAQLTPDERKAADYLRAYYAEFKKLGLESGVLKDALDAYATHLFVFGNQTKSFVEEALTKYRRASLTSPFGKPRQGPPTIEEAKAAGLKIVTEDAADIADIYGTSMSRAIANKNFTESLLKTQNPDAEVGGALAAKRRDQAPAGYQQVGDLWVHPDIAPSTRFVLDSYNPGTIRRALDMVNFASKRMLVSLSLFHPKALVDAAIGGSNWIAPGAAKMLGVATAGAAAGAVIDENHLRGATVGAFLGGILGSKVPGYISGKDALLKQLRTAGVDSDIGLAMKTGLKFSLEKGSTSLEDIGYGETFYKGMKGLADVADRIVPYGSLPIKASEKLMRLSDKYMWERQHAGQKLNMWMEKFEELTTNNAKAHEANPEVPLKSREEIGEIASKFTNSVFGGLDWMRLAEGVNNRFGRELAQAVMDPSARRIAQLVLFAPDWTVSTTLAMLAARGKGTGLKGLLKPQELADLHRQYLVRSFLFYSAMATALNVAFTGRPYWENKDPTRVDLGDGRTLALSKHTMESVHWLLMPRQQMLNKLSTILKLPLEVLTGKEYLSVGGHAPDITSVPIHMLKAVTPIGIQQAMEGGEIDFGNSAAGMLGVPIYGKTREQRREAAMKLRVQRAIEGSKRAREMR